MAPELSSQENTPSGTLITAADFERLMEPFGPYGANERFAVAVSGGADSMALACLSKTWAEAKHCHVVGLTVDHRLRDEAATEAGQVERWFSDLGLSHYTMVWHAGKTVGQLNSSPQAAAREARFDLMIEWCRNNDVSKLLFAHHADDQAETFLQRLVRGSGVDGLAAMQTLTSRSGVALVRPLLARPKGDLIATCDSHGQEWINDPSNLDEKYSRVRLRNLLKALEAEGLDRDRLLNTVTHMQRAKAAIDYAVEELMQSCAESHDGGVLTIHLDAFAQAPEEVALRCLARCLCKVSGAPYPPRFDSLTLVYGDLGSADWTDRTLHGCQLRVQGDYLSIGLEERERQNSRTF